MSFPRYQAYKTSEVEWLEEVPEHWILNKIGLISSLKGRLGWQGLKADEYKDEGPYVLSSAHFKNYQIQWEECPRVTEERYEADANIQLAVKDVLLMKDGAAMGKLAFIESLPGKACLNSHLLLFRPIKIDGALTYHQKFAFCFMQTRYFQEYIRVNGTGATFLGISQDAIGRYKVCWPHLREQTQIASFLDHETAKIDGLIAEQERLIELLQEKRQAVISHVVTKGLNPNAAMKDSGVEWLGEVPEHWGVCRVKAISSFTTSGPRGWSEQISEEGALFVQSGDLNDSLGLAFEKCKRVRVLGDAEAVRTKLQPGDAVVCITGAKTGNAAICQELPEDAYVNQHLCLIRPQKNIDPGFLGLLLKSDCGQTHFGLAQYGLKQGLSLENVRQMPLALPPIQEQIEIVRHVNKAIGFLTTLIKNSHQSVGLLQERRSALISAAVTGQIDVRGLVAEEETA